eukprot:TRINITY_DN3011_c0_g1_i1.p1 TRINITY_DN3011_c0_g1~~TRINITY_DN3011_c0_g1_i1.p1  ORF type:complete len:1524 (+),score=468.92 TRINITY_DN3011_c0_g1_i1:46-4617(+)
MTRFLPPAPCLGLAFLIVLSFSTFAEAQKKRKPIITALNAKWNQTPLVLEAAEYLNSENSDFFWSYVSALSKIGDLSSKTDEEKYELVLEVAAKSLNPSQLDILKFSLSLRTESPKIEMHSHLAIDRGVAEMKCPTVFDYGEKLSCSLPTLNGAASKSVGYDIDHVYPSVYTDDTPEVIVYGEVGTEELSVAHTKMVELANDGKVKYVLRHFVSRISDEKVRLSGYGVELQIKSTEYKAQDDTELDSEDNDDSSEETEEEVEGFLFNTLKSLHPDKVEKLSEMKQHLLDLNNDMAPMKVWQLQDLSLQAAQRIMASPAEERLKVMSDLASNFPSHARSLSKTTVPKDLKKEVKKNSEIFYSTINVQPNDAALFINGQHFDMDFTDIFTILDTLRSEERVLGGLGSLGLTAKQTQSLMTLDLGSKQQTYGVDVRDSAVHWINDIEKDKLYKGWPGTVQELLRPTFPGMLRSIKKNFFNIVVMCDPAKAASKPVLKLVESFYVHRAPTRIGLVFSVDTDLDKIGDNDAGVAIMNAFNYISTNKEPYDALAFITDVYSKGEDGEDVSLSEVRDTFMDSYGADVKMDDVFGEDSEYDVGRSLSEDFIIRSGLGSLPQVLMNGVPFEQKHLTSEDFEEQLLTTIMKETQVLQRAVYKNQLTDSMDLLDFLMQRENIMPRLNQRILSSSNTPMIALAGDQQAGLSLDSFSGLDKRSMGATLAKHLPYLVGKEGSKISKLRMVTVWVIVDLETPAGRAVAKAAVSHVKSTNQMRVGFVHNTPNPGMISRAVEAAVRNLGSSAAVSLLSKILKEDTANKLMEGKKKLADYDIPGVEMNDFIKQMEEIDDELFKIHRTFVKNVLAFDESKIGVVTNGKVIGPLGDKEDLTNNDFDLLEKLTMSQYGEKLVQAFHNHLDVNTPEVSDQAMLVAGLLTSRPAGKPRQDISFKSDQHSVITVDPRFADRPAFDVVAVVDPISRGSQKISPVLMVLQQVLNAKIRVFLNCVDKHSEMPNKSFFKQVLEASVTFNDDGSLTAGPKAAFHNIPEQPILTLNMHTPDNWLVEPVKSVYDLDNIKLETIDGAVTSEWELGSLLLEGHCFESGSGNPPRGLQLTLGTKNNPDFTDTIVMANLGYLQLKAAPGAWYLNLRDGRSADIYDIVSQENTDSKTGSKDVTVLMNSFQSRIVKLKVAKKADKKNEELLPQDGNEDSGNGWFSSITNQFAGSGAADEEEDQGLNIFCVATGHLYERLLKIMMLSVMKTTKTPVKFWILKNFLSPSLKDFIPEYAKRYGFEYEYVHYKWPRWLNQQTERQRTIWGYKILFLDVLFPLSLKKIIFVDTDQIVRTDLMELREFDLGGAPYGYTPFCDSNEDMEGFRFWKQGYWRNHLAGRKYHISAIYVVDLVKFRQIAAGDRLRGQYQALSQDPNSLSNLDQDLPNNMIHQVPIKSLPQEWLWCETWCSKESLKDAKSIDLCNNPLTKEPKLSAARRIVVEWTDYDEEMQRLGQEIAKDRLEAAGVTAASDDKTKSKDEL